MDPEWLEQGVLDAIKTEVLELHPAPRLRPPRGARDPPRPGAGRDRAGPRRRLRCRADELTALFAETRPEAIEDMRQAADELRAELAGDTVTFVVNRNINVSNICTVGCAFCGFGQGKRSPDAYEHDRDEFVRRVRGGGRLRRHRDLHAVGDPPRLGARGLRGLAAAGEGGRRRDMHLHAYSAMEVDACAHVRPAAGRGLRAAARRRARLDAGHRRRGAPRRRARADLAEQAAGGALGRDHRGEPRRRAALHGRR